MSVPVIVVGEATLMAVRKILVVPPVNQTFAFGWKPVPARLVILTVDPWAPYAGVLPVMVGPGLVTVNPENGV